MAADSNYLIVYGTLRPPFTNPATQFLRQRSRYLGNAAFPGLLFDLGSYPGAIYQPDGITRVTGAVYDIGSDKQAILAYLDDYEGVGELFDWPNEYVRLLIPVYCRQAVINCWVYLYNLSTAEKPLITSGDYVRYSLNE